MDDTAAVQPSLAEFETRTFGDVTLVQGDCLAVMPKLMLGNVAFCFADLPYGILKHRDWDTEINLPQFWEALRKISSIKCVTAMTANMRFASSLVASCQKYFRYDLVWRKRYASNFLMAKKRVLSIHEHVLVFSIAAAHTYNPQMRPESLRQKTWTQITAPSSICNWHQGAVKNQVRVHGDMYPVSIIETFEPRTGKVHPTQKPVALLEWLIATYTNPGDLILDPTAGSGTTGCAALNLGRRAVLIEKDPTYFEVMCKRIAEHQQKIEADRE